MLKNKDGSVALTVAEIAARWGVTYPTVSKLVQEGALPVQKLGRTNLVTGDDLLAYEKKRLEVLKAEYDEKTAPLKKPIK